MKNCKTQNCLNISVLGEYPKQAEAEVVQSSSLDWLRLRLGFISFRHSLDGVQILFQVDRRV